MAGTDLRTRLFRPLAFLEATLLAAYGALAVYATLSCRAVPRYSPAWFSLIGLPVVTIALAGVTVFGAITMDVRRGVAAMILGAVAAVIWFVLAYGTAPLHF